MTAGIWRTAMVTGHRPQHLDVGDILEWVTAELARVARKLVDEHGVTTLISGMALGVDQMWGCAAVGLDVALAAHVPFPQQPDIWRDPVLKDQWQQFVDYAEKTGGVTVYGDLAGIDDEQARRRKAIALLHERNGGMIRDTMYAGGVTVAVLRSSKTDGGTRSAYQKALVSGLPIIRIDPDRRTTTMASAGNQKTSSYEQGTLPI